MLLVDAGISGARSVLSRVTPKPAGRESLTVGLLLWYGSSGKVGPIMLQQPIAYPSSVVVYKPDSFARTTPACCIGLSQIDL